MIRCGRCGADNPDPANYCQNCGLPMTPGMTESAPTPMAMAPRAGLESSTPAVLSLVLGLISWVGFTILTAIPAIVLGHMARAQIRREPDRLTGDGLALGGLVLGYFNVLASIVGGIAIFLLVNWTQTTPIFGAAFGGAAFGQAQSRSSVSRVRADMRSMAAAIESYYIDNTAYPAMVPLTDFVTGTAIIDVNTGAQVYGPHPGRDFYFRGLTTPMPYLIGSFPDQFPLDSGQTFAYHTDGAKGWILYSPGPDLAFDIDPVYDYDPDAAVQPESLILKTYDPSNGATSGGDIWRIKN